MGTKLYSVERRAKKIKLSSVTHVPSGLMGCASVALGWWVGGRRDIQTWLNFFAPRCTGLGLKGLGHVW